MGQSRGERLQPGLAHQSSGLSKGADLSLKGIAGTRLVEQYGLLQAVT